MTILSRYLLVRFLLGFFGALLVLNAVVLIAETLLQLNEQLEVSGSFGTAMSIIALRIPAEYFRLTFPMAGFTGAFMSLALAARNNEVLAMKAIGISPLRVITPVLVAALPLSILSFIAYETASVGASRSLMALEQDGELATFGGDAAWFRSGPTLYRIHDAELDRGVLKDVRLYERGEKGLLLRAINASSANIHDDQRWELHDVQIYNFDPEQPKAATLYETADQLWVDGIDPGNLMPFDPNQIFFSLRDLQKRIASLERDGASAVGLKAQFQARVTEPWVFFIFCFLAAPLGLDVERTKSVAKPALRGLGLIALFLVLRSFGHTLSSSGGLDPIVCAWAAVLLFLVWGTKQAWEVNR